MIRKALLRTAQFYDERKVGEDGRFGFRRSSDLMLLYRNLDKLIDNGIIRPKETVFLDLGCADGRVNVFFSYLTKASIGIEIDDWSLEECPILLSQLTFILKKEGLPTPENNIFLFHGDVFDPKVYEKIRIATGYKISDIDVFYTYLFMYNEFSEILRKKGRKGAFFIIYGVGDIIPRLEGLEYIDFSIKGLGIYRLT